MTNQENIPTGTRSSRFGSQTPAPHRSALQQENLSPEEKFDSISKLNLSILTLGEVLSDIKRTKLFLFKGYERFNDFISAEYHFSSPLPAKLIGIYELFVDEMDISVPELAEIGFDRLSMIKPLCAKAAWAVREEWLQKAKELLPADLKAEIKKLKESEKEQNLDLKDVFVDEYFEMMLALFNCSRKELNFKLALFFHSADLDAFKGIVKEYQKLFEQTLIGVLTDPEPEAPASAPNTPEPEAPASAHKSPEPEAPASASQPINPSTSRLTGGK
jgi:hypothetical protein